MWITMFFDSHPYYSDNKTYRFKLKNYFVGENGGVVDGEFQNTVGLFTESPTAALLWLTLFALSRRSFLF